jgi:hypothetical protein
MTVVNKMITRIYSDKLLWKFAMLVSHKARH